MVKGISRRVIVVDSPDPRIFEQAIFILRNDMASGSGGVSSQQLVDQAVRIAKVMADNGVDMSALSLADTTDFGILRLIVNDPDKATEVLRTHDFIVKQSPVIAAVVDDRPGGLTEVLQILSFAGVSVEYMYASVGSQQGHAVVVMRTDRAEAAMAALESHHVNTLDPKDIYRI